MFNHSITQSITFFRSEDVARALAAKGEMTEADGFFVSPAKGLRGDRGAFVIEVRDTDDGLLLGYI